MAPIDWQTRKTLSECTKYLLDNTMNCDVNFKVGGNQEMIKAHKFILSMRSAVFEKMFHGSFCESGKDFVVLDVSAAAFQAVLRYCYYDCTDIQDDIALCVLYASTKYMLPLLEEAARRKVMEIVGSPKYIWDTYKYAVDVGDTDLLDACRKYFKGNITPVQEALQAEAFLKIPQNVLLDFLHINDEVDESLLLPENQKSDSVKTNSVKYQNCIGISVSEIKLFKACNAWAESECLREEIDSTGANKRKVLGECVFLLRFPTMLQEDLSNDVSQTGILTQDELLKLLQHKYQKTASRCHVGFPLTERQFISTFPISAKDQREGILSITSEERVILSRVWTLFPGSYSITLKNERSERTCSSKCDTQYAFYAAELSCDTYTLYFIDLEPQILEAGITYTLTVNKVTLFKHPDSRRDMKNVIICQELPFNEIKLSLKSDSDIICALTLCLI